MRGTCFLRGSRSYATALRTSTGRESQAQTGEPHALEGPAQPRSMQAITHVFAADYVPGEDHTIDQPDLYAAFLFNAARRPDLTQKWARWVLEKKYGDRENGLDGNDDGGSLSAWYVFASLGLTPMSVSTRTPRARGREGPRGPD